MIRAAIPLLFCNVNISTGRPSGEDPHDCLDQPGRLSGGNSSCSEGIHLHAVANRITPSAAIAARGRMLTANTFQQFIVPSACYEEECFSACGFERQTGEEASIAARNFFRKTSRKGGSRIELWSPPMRLTVSWSQ